MQRLPVWLQMEAAQQGVHALAALRGSGATYSPGAWEPACGGWQLGRTAAARHATGGATMLRPGAAPHRLLACSAVGSFTGARLAPPTIGSAGSAAGAAISLRCAGPAGSPASASALRLCCSAVFGAGGRPTSSSSSPVRSTTSASLLAMAAAAQARRSPAALGGAEPSPVQAAPPRRQARRLGCVRAPPGLLLALAARAAPPWSWGSGLRGCQCVLGTRLPSHHHLRRRRLGLSCGVQGQAAATLLRQTREALDGRCRPLDQLLGAQATAGAGRGREGKGEQAAAAEPAALLSRRPASPMRCSTWAALVALSAKV